ncbi:hypothetical protein HMI54_007273 [Coelomomyces lativittatus]|nr:hypothetical protein HMI56_003093 [Coelomomyces lativittatus]KAJ1517057.1 hypothetical protein HMI54_007273 [Coelomomyces lativittatus]KAJ1517563.1 hypothetical protein HMI55_006684 [Coelomomyces lativittatus]
MLFPFPTIQPVSNRLLAERWDKKRFERHQKSLQNAKPSVDNTCPMYFNERNKINMKKIQLQKDQQADIDHRNRLLLSKFKQVARATAKAYQCEPTFVGLRETLCERQHTKRVQQLAKIDRENKMLLTRLEAVTPTYRASNWHHDRIQTLHYLANVSHHKEKYVKEMESLAGTYKPGLLDTTEDSQVIETEGEELKEHEEEEKEVNEENEEKKETRREDESVSVSVSEKNEILNSSASTTSPPS